MQKLRNISKLPVPTWSWLSINSASLDIEEIKPESNSYQPMEQIPNGVTISYDIDKEFPSELILKETVGFAQYNCNHTLNVNIDKGIDVSEPIVLSFRLADGETLVNNICITADEDSNATVVVRYESDDENHAFHCGYTCVDVKKGANLQYIGIQHLGENDIHADAFQAEVEENGKLNVLMTELGANKTSVAGNVKLTGKGAETEFDSIYVGVKESKKDYNYRVEFGKKENIGHIVVRGVLGGKARKNMKSTIDFISGASGSKGREEESVLVLSDSVINRSTPLLLCGEDFVEGEHATSIGKPNKDKLYYLMTRGFSEREAKKLLVEASLIPLLDKINDENLKESLTSLVREVVRDAE